MKNVVKSNWFSRLQDEKVFTYVRIGNLYSYSKDWTEWKMVAILRENLYIGMAGGVDRMLIRICAISAMSQSAGNQIDKKLKVSESQDGSKDRE